ncbi:hypothetical protein HDV04_000543 [Boothiomyces sp. JEL0838]|nr:hypothetical protein HDV04_000543 [Boothiomyces sp. JEL0838]
MSISLMYESAESNLMNRAPRNARTDHLADWKFFLQVYCYIGAMDWISAMTMWFMFMAENGLYFYDLMLVYDKWQDGWAGKSLETLNDLVLKGQGIYFVTMAICQFGTLMAVRNRTTSILESNPLWGPRKNLDSKPDAKLQVLFRTLTTYNTIEMKSKANDGNKPAPIKAHLLRDNDLCIAFSTDIQNGLEAPAIARKEASHGLNVLTPAKTNYFMKFLGYTFGGFNSLMWLAAIISFISYEPLGGPGAAIFPLGVGILLIIVIFISTVFYAYVDYNASKIMQSIQGMVAQQALVIREGNETLVDAAKLVPGDVVLLSMGQRVPADIRLVEVSSDLLFDRSLLTGESKLVNGTTAPTDENALESKNLALSSTFVVRGKAKGVVFQTGDKTIIGQIVQMSGKQKTVATPIQRELNTFTIIISTLAFTFFIVSVLAWACWIRTSYPLYENAASAMVNALGCLTAFVPQGLPVCFALALTIIAKRMSDRNVLVKNLSTIETLGCMSVLCSDKTGTLTMGKMQVCNVMFVDQSLPEDENDSDAERSSKLNGFPGFKMVSNFSSICCDATFLPGNENLPIKDRPVNGDLTDSAILRFSEGYQKHIFDVKPKVIFSLAFNSKNKFMAKVVTKEDGDIEMLIKGAPDILMPSCTEAILSTGGSEDMEKVSSTVNDLQRKASSSGFRVLALCKKSLKGLTLPTDNQDEFEKLIINEIKGLTLVGMLSIRDPPRKETLPTVNAMKKAGIRVFMVTGDFELTAFSIAKQVGIVTTENAYSIADLPQLKKDNPLPPNLKNFDYHPHPDDPVRAIVFNGKDLANISEQDWDFIARFFSEMVFARTTPEQKLLIVEHLKSRGDNIIAVTGDGTNDAPALKAADIGVAMGNGTDVAKEAAAMILLDSDFSSLLVGIENGRLVFENLKKVIMYLMPAGSYGELMATISTVFFGMQSPMTAFQQVLFCVTNDVFMSISLMYETAESNLMNKPPRNARTDHLADWKFFLQIYMFIGAMVWISAMGMWFMFMADNGLHFNDLMLVYDKWQDGWAGQSIDSLNNSVYIGDGVYYVTLAICQFGTLFAVRNRTSSIFESNPLWGPRKNLVIPFSMAGSILICILSLYLPFIQNAFYTAPIPAKYWGIPFLLALGIIIMDEIRKALVRAFPKSFIAKMAW